MEEHVERNGPGKTLAGEFGCSLFASLDNCGAFDAVCKVTPDFSNKVDAETKENCANDKENQ